MWTKCHQSLSVATTQQWYRGEKSKHTNMIHATYFYRRKGNKIYSGRQFPQPMKSLLRHLSRARCKKGRPEKRFSIPGTKCPNISRTNHSRNLHRGVALYFQKHSKNDIFQNNKNFNMNLSPVSFSYI